MSEQRLVCGQCRRTVLHVAPRADRAPSAESLLRTLNDLAQDLRERWPAYEATEAYRANPTLRAAGGPGRGSDVPDPVHAIVASFGHYEETKALLSELTGMARNLQRRMFAVLEEYPEIAQEALTNMKHWRCTGQYDPTCTRLADHQRGKYKGWCDRCVRAFQRQEQAEREAQAS